MRKTNVVKRLVAAACTGAMVLSFLPSSAFAHSWGTDMGGGSFGGESCSFADSAPSDRGAYDFAPSNNAAEAAASYTDYSFNMESYSSSDMQESIRSSAVSAQYSSTEEPANQLSVSENRQMQDVQTWQEAVVHTVFVTENAEVQNPAEEGSIPTASSDDASAVLRLAVSADSEVPAAEYTIPGVEEPSAQDAGEGEQASYTDAAEESHTEQTEAAEPVVSESAPATEETAENGSIPSSLPEETASFSSEEVSTVNS